MTKIYATIFSVLLATVSIGQLRINEASNANGTILVLPDGKRPDLLELYNSSATSIDLEGYTLSDDADELNKWTFTSGSVPASGFMTILANGKNNTETLDHWETAVFSSDTWKYTIPAADLPSDWNTISFSPVGWTDAVLGIGYGDGDDVTTVAAPLASVYVRKTFNISDVAAIEAAIFDVDFDDGFVAYINGVEIARTGLVGTPPAWDENAADHEAQLYGGGSITSFEIDPTFLSTILVNGTNVLAIEVHNTNPGSSDLSLIPFLSFGFNDGTTYFGGTVHPYFVPGGDLSFLSTNFSIASAGETIYLANPAGVVVDSLVVPDLEPNMSVGKYFDGTSTHLLFLTPTFGASNNSASPFTNFENTPTINLDGGFYGAAVNATITNTSLTGGTIHYTLDGQNPTAASPVYSGAISIPATAVLRAICISGDSDYLPSLIATETYLILEDFTLPVISITTDPANLFGGEGIFDNWWTDWRKPCVIEYFDADGNKQFESRASIKPDGGAGGSRSNPQHSVTIEPSNSLLGEGMPVEYPMIPAKDYIDEFHAFYLRNGSNFWNAYPQKDATFMRMMQETNVNSQAYSPVIAFVNGEYYGVYEVREKANENYFEGNYGNNPDSIDLLSVSYFYGAGVLRTVKGSNESFYEMHDYVTSSDPTAADYLTTAHEKIDVYNYADYIAAENWIGNVDWIYNNIKTARMQTFDDKWRFYLQDVELGLGGWTDYNANIFDFFRYENLPNPYREIYDGLMANPEYHDYFINRFADLMNTTYQPSSFTPIVTEMYEQLLPEMPKHFEKWTGDIGGGMGTYDYYYYVIIDQFTNRNAVVRDQIVNEFSLEKQVDVTLSTVPEGAGYIKISTIVPETLPWTGVYFDGVPVKMTAVANPGYTFVGWEENSLITGDVLLSQSIELNISSDEEFKALFTGSEKPLELTISEIHYHPDSTLDGGNWIELHNYGSTPLEMTNWSIKSKNFWDKFIFPELTEIPANGYLVVCEDTNMFKVVYPTITNFVGGTGYGWDNNFDSISIFNATNEMVLNATYSDDQPFPLCADGWGRSMENKFLNEPNFGGEAWFCGCIGGSPGLPYSPCVEPLTFSEINYNDALTPYNAGDWFELRNNTGAPINLNNYQFKDANANNTYTLPDVVIPAGGYWVFSNNLDQFNTQHSSVVNVSGIFDFGLSGTDILRMYSSEGILVNSVLYRNDGAWPTAPSVSNFTLEAVAPETYQNPNLAVAWFVGCEGGSPGRAFSPCGGVIPEGQKAGLYPNPTEGLINLVLDNTKNPSGITRIAVFDLAGRIVYFDTVTSIDDLVSFVFDFTHFAGGTYIIRVIQDNEEIPLPFVKI